VRFPLSLVAAMPAMRYQERSKKASALDSGMAPLRRGLLFWRIRRPPRCRHTRGSRGRPGGNRQERSVVPNAGIQPPTRSAREMRAGASVI
jgi:hypothetical protein